MNTSYNTIDMWSEVMVPSPTSRPTTDQCLCPRCRATNRGDANFCVRCGAPLLLGTMYRIDAVLKEGGMGTVYRGRDGRGEPCALKELRDQFTDTSERESGIRRFMEEGRLLHSLRDHPAIPKVYRSFVDNGRYYLAMEFIHGEDLEDVLHKRGRFSELQVLLWADQLCDVLQYLHDNGLIYRDMKPSNVMITRNGQVKVVDFGIAQLLRPGHRGTMIGTPGYAPPEQYQGITNAQSDVYALAATLHHLLTGRDPREHAPFSFPPVHTLNPDVSRAMSRVLQKALQLEMEDRYPTVFAFRQALPALDSAIGATRMFDEVPRRPPPPRQTAATAHKPARPQRGGFRRRVRRTLLAAMIGVGLLYTAPEWAPALGTAISSAIQNIAEQWNNESAAPINGTSDVIGAGTQRFEAEVEVEVPANATRNNVYAAFEQAFLTQALDKYPSASLPPQELNVQLSEDGSGQLQPTPVADGVVRYRATLQGTIVTNAP